MLSFVQLDKPHIDIELYGTDTNIAPIDKVHIMDEDSFEQFTLEWLFGCKKSKYSSIKRIGEHYNLEGRNSLKDFRYKKFYVLSF